MANIIDLSRIHGELKSSNNQLIKGNFNNSLVSEIKFVNMSNKDIVVCFRDGTYSILQANITQQNKEALIIGYKKSNRLSPILTINGENSDVTNHIRNELLLTNNSFSYIEEILPTSKIERTRTGYYVDNADVVIAIANQITDIPYHPFAKQRIHNLYLNSADDFDPKTEIGISIRYVRNESSYHRFYAIFHNNIIVLNGKPSNTLASGVYIAGLVSLDLDDCNTIRDDKFYSLTDIEQGVSDCPIKLFKTLQEAQLTLKQQQYDTGLEERLNREHELFITQKKQEQQIKDQELKSIDQELKRMEKENKLLQIEKNASEERLKKKIAELEQIERQEKLENDKRYQEFKEELSRKTAETKLFTETVKVIGIGLGIMLTIYKFIV